MTADSLTPWKFWPLNILLQHNWIFCMFIPQKSVTPSSFGINVLKGPIIIQLSARAEWIHKKHPIKLKHQFVMLILILMNLLIIWLIIILYFTIIRSKTLILIIISIPIPSQISISNPMPFPIQISIPIPTLILFSVEVLNI